MKHLEELTEFEFNSLKQINLLKNLYPEAPEKYTSIKRRPLPKLVSEINVQPLIKLMESIFDQYEAGHDDDDNDHWCYEELVNTIYGHKAWDWINNIKH